MFLYLIQPPEKLYKTAGMSTLSKTEERKTQKRRKVDQKISVEILFHHPPLCFLAETI